jgi:hypothetical protein
MSRGPMGERGAAAAGVSRVARRLMGSAVEAGHGFWQAGDVGDGVAYGAGEFGIVAAAVAVLDEYFAQGSGLGEAGGVKILSFALRGGRGHDGAQLKVIGRRKSLWCFTT